MPESYPSIVYYVTFTYFCFMIYMIMLTTNFIFQFQQKNKHITFTLKEPFFQGKEIKQSRIHTIMYQDIYIDNNEAKKKWFPLGFISLFKTV